MEAIKVNAKGLQWLASLFKLIGYSNINKITLAYYYFLVQTSRNAYMFECKTIQAFAEYHIIRKGKSPKLVFVYLVKYKLVDKELAKEVILSVIRKELNGKDKT